MGDDITDYNKDPAPVLHEGMYFFDSVNTYLIPVVEQDFIPENATVTLEFWMRYVDAAITPTPGTFKIFEHIDTGPPIHKLSASIILGGNNLMVADIKS